MGVENVADDEPSNFDSLQMEDDLNNEDLDQIYEGSFVQMKLTNQHKLERNIRFDN